MPQQQRNNRVALLIVVYFGSSTASLAWILYRAGPARERTWSSLVQDAATLWDTVPSELAVFVYLNFFVSALAMVALITAALFLGRLTAIESQRLSHRLVKYAVFNMVFVGSIITPDPRDIAMWLAWFSVVGYLRVFLGAAKDRLESLLSSPGAQLDRHLRGVCLLLLVLLHNALAFVMVFQLLPGRSTARVLLCAFDSAVVAIEGTKTLLRYSVYMADRYQYFGSGGAAAAAVPRAASLDDAEDAAAATAVMGGSGGGWDVGCWSGKGSFLYYAELLADVLVHAATLAHYLHVWVLHGLSFHLIDAVIFLDMRAVLLSLLRRLRGHLSYRAATTRLNNTFRDVHPAALAAAAAGGGDAASADCTICMDEIVHVGKQLPCGHVFHLSCLRAWLQQSGSESFTCPNCRKPILVGGPEGDGGQADGEEGDGVGRGQRRRVSRWWIVRMFDRWYVRLVVALEPLLLTLLLSVTLWLGDRAQLRRRSARITSSPPREGYGESPGPSAATRGRDSPAICNGRARRLALDSDPECDVDLSPGVQHGALDAVSEEYSSDESDERDDGGAPSGILERGMEGGLWGEGGQGSDSDDRDADSDVDRERPKSGVAAAEARFRDYSEAYGDGGSGGEGKEYDDWAGGRPSGHRRRCGWRGAARNFGTSGADHSCGVVGYGGGCGSSYPSVAAARRAARNGAGAWELVLEEQYGELAAPHRGAGWDGRRAATTGNAAAGPSAADASFGLRGGRLRGPPPAVEVPSFSVDVLAPRAAAVARRIGRTISGSLRSSWTADGGCGGAVAWAGEESDNGDEHEVSSRLRRRSRRGRPARPGGAGGANGAGGGAHCALGGGDKHASFARRDHLPKD